ncbi:MAG: chemotaxis protein CheX [bacterium]
MSTLIMALKTSISDVLEKMFYMPFEFEDNEHMEEGVSLGEGALYACRINFTGSISGFFTLMLPEEVLSHMTENFMGLRKEEIEDNYLGETLKEFLNMIAGNTFSNYNENEAFHLSIPQLIKPAQALSASGCKNIQGERTIITQTPAGYLLFKITVLMT